jgi:hypothetical protein
MAVIIGANDAFVKVGLDNHVVIEIPRSEVNFIPNTGDQVDVFDDNGKPVLVLRVDPMAKKLTGFPVLDNWSPRNGMTAFGIILSLFLGRIMVMMFENEGFVMGMVNSIGFSGLWSLILILSIVSLLFGIVRIWYSLAIYPKYFTSNPILTDNVRISFLNGFLGGLVFGLIFNHNLKRQVKGISYIIWAIILVLISFWTIVDLYSFYDLLSPYFGY